MLDLEVGKLHAALHVCQVALFGPLPNLVPAAAGSTVAVAAAPVGFLQEALIVPLQVVLEGDALDSSPLLGQPVGCPEVRPVDLGVVRQLALARRADRERLAVVSLLAVGFQDVAPALRQGHEVGPVLTIHGRDMAD